MYLSLEKSLREAVLAHLKTAYDLELTELAIEQPPKAEMGDFALPVCFELARRLKQAPRQIATKVASQLVLPAGLRKIEVAGGGYLNCFADRGALAAGWSARDAALQPAFSGKVVVEHTNINPNKAAHVGHLRNAVLGDTFVRLLRRRGEQVEVQNYIDNTGVQVADVVVAFEHLLGRSPEQVEGEIGELESKRRAGIAGHQLSAEPHALALGDEPRWQRRDYSFDYHCWDLYAQASRRYEEDPETIAWRRAALHAIEHEQAPTAALGDAVATAIVRAHLRTMERLGVRYDVLPRESEILHLHFWETAFALLRERGAVRLEAAGKNAGCWVMDRKGAEAAEADPGQTETAEAGERELGAAESKVIVRSNGTVTYVGKDIAYQLWKFGLLGREFAYRPFSEYPDGHTVWVSAAAAAPAGERQPPAFGRASRVFNVIDVRQSYLQEIVVEGLRALGFDEQAEHSVHFSYEMVALTPRCAEQLGYRLSEEDARRPYVEVSGRKGFGVKADDLLDQLQWRALAEVRQRHPEVSAAEQLELATPIAIGALRYFLLKFTKSAVIAFDFDEAMSFEGETGPYAQYAAVRAGTILKKAVGLAGEDAEIAALLDESQPLRLKAAWGAYLDADHGLWELLRLAARLDAVVEQCLVTREPAFLAKYTFQLAQAFSNFYHKYPVLTEAEGERRRFLLALVRLSREQIRQALALLGIAVPSAM